MAHLRLTLLGGFAAHSAEGTAISLPTRKTAALLSLLACRAGESLRRECLTAMLWTRRSDEQARHSLSQTLTSIRHALGDAAPLLLAAERETIALCPEAVTVDVVEFQRFAGSTAVEDLQAAANLYGGTLLDGLKLREPAFEAWLTAERARLHELAISVLMDLAKRDASLGDAHAAAAALSRVLALDPLAEGAHRGLIRLDLDQGAYNAAIRQYRQCADVLRHELDTVPEPLTTALYRDALDALAAASGANTEPLEVIGIGSDAEIGSASRGAEANPGACTPVYEPPDGSRKPAIAVLPFANLGGDPQQQYFSDGLSEDIITDLSRFRLLRVVARNASFRYRDDGADVKRIGRELAVDYALAGSVRRHGQRIRLTAQLVETASGNHLWGERFDLGEDDVFAVADELVRTVAGTVAGRLQAAGSERLRRKPPANLAAYDCVLRAQAAEMRTGDPAAEAEMRRLYEKAVALDAGYGRAHAGMAVAQLRDWFRDSVASDADLERAAESARRAVALDPNDSECHETLGWILLHCQSFEMSEQCYRRALELNPNSPDELASMGSLCGYLGRPGEGLDWFEQAKRVDPFFDPTWYWHLRGATCFNARRYDDAIAAFSRSMSPPAWVRAYLAACHALAGRRDQARTIAADVTLRSPGFSATLLAAREPFKLAADRQHLLDGLLKAGLPEHGAD
jgi:TolB-like protein/DNA-binding SARP family transcriptional activator